MPDDELERALPSRQAIVEVTLRDGRVLSHHTKDVRGTAQNPMTREEVGEKAFDLCAPTLGKKRARDLVDTVWRIELVMALAQGLIRGSGRSSTADSCK